MANLWNFRPHRVENKWVCPVVVVTEQVDVRVPVKWNVRISANHATQVTRGRGRESRVGTNAEFTGTKQDN